MDFDSPAAALKAVHALKTSGIQAQMAKVSLLTAVPACVRLCMCPHARTGAHAHPCFAVPGLCARVTVLEYSSRLWCTSLWAFVLVCVGE